MSVFYVLFALLFLLRVDGTARMERAAEKEKAALLGFKATVLRDPKGAMNNWNASDLDPCSWNGVECSATWRRVIGLDLTGSNIEGSFIAQPLTFADLNYLQTLKLGQNRFTGSLPRVFGRFSQLKVLDLSGNFLTGGLPQEWLSLQNLIKLNLSDNRLGDKIPVDFNFRFFSALQELDLGYNSFEGSIPGSLGQLKSLTSLVLARNSFSGSIPSTLGQATRLEKLDLSYNSFTGSLPISLCHLSRLKTLQLQHNLLSGEVPSALTQLTSLTSLDLRDNKLSGPVLWFANSTELSRFSVTRNASIENLHPYRILQLSQVNSSPNSQFLPPPPPPSEYPLLPPFTDTTKSKTFTIGVIFAIIFSSIGAAIVVGVCWTILAASHPVPDVTPQLALQPSVNSSSRKPKLRLRKGGHMEPLVTMFGSKPIREFDLLDAIHYSGAAYVISSGEGWTMYRASFPDMTRMAVTVVGKDPLQSEAEIEEYAREISELQHKNVVPLLGFRIIKGQIFLLYDYMPHGTLRDFLHSEKRKYRRRSMWSYRFQIALGVARGLAHLHMRLRSVSPQHIEASTVLLDSNYEPCLGAVGLTSFLPKISEAGQTTPQNGPKSPEHIDDGPNQEDVYSYGVLLLEILMGLNPWDPLLAESDLNIAQWAKSKVEGGKIHEVLDSRVNLEDAEDEMLQILKVALLCTMGERTLRPQMEDVVEMLLRAKDTATKIKETPLIREMLL